MYKIEKSFNNARQKSFDSFCITLKELLGKENISEIDFFDKWQENMSNEKGIIANGWYSPPPKGMAVLFGDRVSFDSLRNEKNWASNRIINWKEDLLYAYCSPIDKTTGIIGDISLTLYFGEDKKIIEHFKNCYNATNEIFGELHKLNNSKELFYYSQEIFSKYKLKNCIISKTDTQPLDLGHTFPTLENTQDKNILTDEEKQIISKARKFINENSSWDFENEMQFTIEPQLVSTENSGLPQISQHYLIKKRENDFVICNDIDSLLEKYQLI